MAISVVQVIFISKSKLLLGFRQNTGALNQFWGFPSGRIEPGELPIEAAKREAFEEVSVAVGELIPLGVLVDPEQPIRHSFYI